MRIGLAQINTTVGDLAGNRERILEAYRELCRRKAELVVFPELAVSGYPPRDLLFKKRFLADAEQALLEIAAATGEVPLIVGFPETRAGSSGRPCFNAAAWCRRGAVEAVGRKSLLPTYDVFDEDRYFEAADGPRIVEHQGRRIGITICEDFWARSPLLGRRLYPRDPIDALKDAGLDLLVNLSASPWHLGKGDLREGLVVAAAEACGCPAVYVNAIGGNDELIFDGRSLVCDPRGTVIAGLASFEEAVHVVDSGGPVQNVAPSFRQEEGQDIQEALALGLRDYVRKSRFQKVLLGLSGGIDSAVCAALAVRALGPQNVIGFSLPSVFSSEHSRSDARRLAENLGIGFHTLPIKDVVSAAEQTLAPLFKGLARDLTEENLQARCRGLLLMGVSNKLGALLLTTGNKSEIAVGYCTLYGDMCGGLAPISDLLKTKVYDLARHINREREIIPLSSIEKAPSAELRPGQTDQDSLPPYPLLDAILEGYIEEGLSAAELVGQGHPEPLVREIIRKVDLSEYKRRQAAPGLKITPLAFGVGRRIPIVQRYVQ